MRLRTITTGLHECLAERSASEAFSVPGLLFEARTDLVSWPDAEAELAEAFTLGREAALADAPIVYLVRSAALLGRSAPLDAAVATGLLGGARAIAFERRKARGYASVVALGADVAPATVADSIELLLAGRAANGQILTLGSDHLGAALP
ncbi:hypothetical protein IU471_19005 [Nocardia elegans]|uniref:hypothetical protein n=1 Tax=Nocardia elegans TaxID=300029 RepID=UPI0018949957|nr:hypothetical protein [Nocardia elegans]MBF6245655.1 hypothetical protein [Nocardia elegans]